MESLEKFRGSGASQSPEERGGLPTTSACRACSGAGSQSPEERGGLPTLRKRLGLILKPRLNPLKNGAVFRHSLIGEFDGSDRLNPLKNGAVFRLWTAASPARSKGLNPLKNGAVFRRHVVATNADLTGLNPLKNGAVFRPRPDTCSRSSWVSIP